MNASKKYIHIFGSISSLEERISWVTGVSNMLEWLLWETKCVLGVSKTKYRDKIIGILSEDEAVSLDMAGRKEYVENKINCEMAGSERYERYDPATSSIAHPREALRRAKYLSEDYLNKEFDIFWCLVSNSYLDEFYAQFVNFDTGHNWYTHGNSGIFGCSTGISEMQMDNLSYNPGANVLIANELKLGGKKNKDQILKYALMYKLLVERGFIKPDVRFVLIFFGDKKTNINAKELVADEIKYCSSSSKSTHNHAISDDCVNIAISADYAALTWDELIKFNKQYLGKLDEALQEVEYKLIWGFNEALANKAFMNKDLHG